jgi:hypothetical protein
MMVMMMRRMRMMLGRGLLGTRILYLSEIRDKQNPSSLSKPL